MRRRSAVDSWPASATRNMCASALATAFAAQGAVAARVQKWSAGSSVGRGFTGVADAAFRLSLTNEVFLIITDVITMYIVLGVLYESFIDPINILSTLPSAGNGALLTLMMAGGDFDVIVMIGVILLSGIVKKNAIMMTDLALDADRNEGHTTRDASYQAWLLRFLPIMMTTTAALLGALPLMLGTGTGSELCRPLGLAIVSQVLTLFTTPYFYFDRLAARLSGRRSDRLAGGKAFE